MDIDEDKATSEAKMELIRDLDVSDSLGRPGPSFDDEVSTLLPNQLGSVGRSHRGESCAAARRLVTEVFSPPRMTKLIRDSLMRHVMPGYALDLTTVDPADGLPLDFSLRTERMRARKLLREQRPYLVIGSLQCKEFCTFQTLSQAKRPDDCQKRAAREAAEVHLEVVSQLYKHQIDGGRYFPHQHPRWATSWCLRCIGKISRQPGVATVHGDQCHYGAETQSSDGMTEKGSPVLKPIGIMTNSEELAAALSRRCRGTGGQCSWPRGGVHRRCTGKHARARRRSIPQICSGPYCEEYVASSGPTTC